MRFARGSSPCYVRRDRGDGNGTALHDLATLTVWTPDDLALLGEYAGRLHSRRDEIAAAWTERLFERLGPPFRGNPEAFRRVCEINRWFLESLFQRLGRGELDRLFRDNFESNLALLRSQAEVDPEIRTSLPQLYLSLSLASQAIVEHLLQAFAADPRLPRILELNGRLGILLGEVLGRAFYEVHSETTERALRTASSLLESSRELGTRAASVDGVARKLTEIVRRLVRCDKTIAFLWEESEQAYVAQAALGFASEHFLEIRAMRFRRGTFSMMDDVLDGHIVSGTRDDGRVPEEVMQRYDEMVYAVAPMNDPDGRPLGTLAAYRRERQLFDQTDIEILRGVAQNAALALENARLVEQLEASSRLKSDFINSMSHEIRTPLNVLMGYQEMLDDHLADAPADREILGRMRQNTTYLLELVNTILDVGRIEAGKVPLRSETFAVDDVIQAVREAFAPLAASRGLDFDCRARGPLPPLTTDRLKLLEILNNLVANAIKFTDRGSVTLLVGHAPDGNGMLFEVEDTGIGIEPDALHEVFDVFRQTGPADRGGTGLGLYIVKRLSVLLGGGVSVESIPGHGSTFRVVIPVRLPAPEGARKSA